MFEVLFYLLVFVFGTCVGSFLNSVIYRLKTKEKISLARSHCPNCQHQLRWQDLIPVFSFICLRGRCRYCQKKISIQYPLVELLTGALFVLIIYYHLPFTVYHLLISSFLIVIFVYDLKHYIIPDKIIFPAIIISFSFNLVRDFVFDNLTIEQFSHSVSASGLWAAILASVFFLAIFLISKGRWLGFGDVKMAFLMGLFLGFPKILLALFFSFLFGAIIWVGLIVFKKKTLKSEVPFGPFLVIGTFLAMFWGELIINWYLNLLHL